jgi:hypothetical protein
LLVLIVIQCLPASSGRFDSGEIRTTVREYSPTLQEIILPTDTNTTAGNPNRAARKPSIFEDDGSDYLDGNKDSAAARSSGHAQWQAAL